MGGEEIENFRAIMVLENRPVLCLILELHWRQLRPREREAEWGSQKERLAYLSLNPGLAITSCDLGQVT